MLNNKLSLAVAVLCLSTLTLAGCSTATQNSSNGAVKANTTSQYKILNSGEIADLKADDAASRLVPAEIRDRGTLLFGGESASPPFLFSENGELTGVEADLTAALSVTLGLSPQLIDTQFASMIPGLTSGRFDIAMSNFTDTVKRQEQVTFVDYSQSVSIIVVPRGNPRGVSFLEDLCGLRAAGPTGSLSVELAEEQSRRCKESGKPEIEVQTYPGNAETSLAVQNGRADAIIDNYAISQYEASLPGSKTETVGESFRPTLTGAAMRKDDTELIQAVEKGFSSIIANGTYQRILDKWNVPEMAVKEVGVNGGK